MRASRAAAISFFLWSCITHTTYVPAWTKQYSTFELFKLFRYDPHCPGLPQGLEQHPERIDELAINFEKAKFFLHGMGLVEKPVEHFASVDYWVTHGCYRFAACYEDPLAHWCMKEIATLPYEQKLAKVNQRAEKLEQRLMFAQLLRWKAETKYEADGIEPALCKQFGDIVWQYRYFFADYQEEPWIELIINDIPKDKCIPLDVQEQVMQRFDRVCELLDKHRIPHASNMMAVAYDILTLRQISHNPTDDCIRFFLDMGKDTYPELYAHFFTDKHLDKINTYYTDILDGIQIRDELGLDRNKRLRYCYSTLLTSAYTSEEQRAVVRACFELIMHACTLSDNMSYIVLVEHITKAIQGNADKTIIVYPQALLALRNSGAQCATAVQLIEQLQTASDISAAQQALNRFLTSLL